jgi:site-specific DNA recombinase
MIGQKKNGQPRYGRRWVADPALAPLVAQAFAMRAEGAGYTAILKGPLAGVYKSASCLPTVFANHRYVVGGVITEELFQRVQAVNLRHARKEGQAHPRRIASACLLSGLVFCRCESPMVGSTSSGRGYHYRYYRCTQQMNRRNDACNQPRIRADYLENAVLDSVLAHFQKPEQIAELTEAVNEELNGDDGLQAEADRLRQQIADVEAAIARLVAALEKGGHLESLLDSLKTREAERVRLRNDLLLVEAEIAARRPTVLTPQEVATLLGEIRQHREAEDTLELRAILRLVIERMVVEGESYQICYRPEVRPYFT